MKGLTREERATKHLVENIISGVCKYYEKKMDEMAVIEAKDLKLAIRGFSEDTLSLMAECVSIPTKMRLKKLFRGDSKRLSKMFGDEFKLKQTTN